MKETITNKQLLAASLINVSDYCLKQEARKEKTECPTFSLRILFQQSWGISYLLDD